MEVVAFLLQLLAFSHAEETLNDRPIIGIVSEELTDKMTQNYGPHKSYIASSYVQFVHGAGARAVPILVGESKEYYQEVLQYVNGVLLPGGSVWFDNKTGGYVEAGRWILEEAEAMNARGDYFPVWGTCLGFELMSLLQNDLDRILVNCSSYNEASPLILTEEASQSRMFSEAPKDILDILTNKNSTTNFHRFCLTPKDLRENVLGEKWSILSTSVDDYGLEYVSTVEDKTRPFYATQWHPEKPLYEWGHFKIPHDKYTVRISQYMADFFVNQARKNSHSFPSEEVERQYLIYNYPATFGHATSTYTQLYFFD